VTQAFEKSGPPESETKHEISTPLLGRPSGASQKEARGRRIFDGINFKKPRVTRGFLVSSRPRLPSRELAGILLGVVLLIVVIFVGLRQGTPNLAARL
jgi:hypothetical protein